jgi:diguanylate cyclase (GGDEF)-like protein
MSSTHIAMKTSKINNISGSGHSHAIIRVWVNLAKRSLDICMSLIGLILLTPFFIYISLLIRRDSPGPVFYWGPRMGKNRKTFNILKFRTMYEDKNSYEGPRVTGQGDVRITPLGQWLRDTKINELPQLWNVLIGEMSLVGPRPEDIEIARTWPADIAEEILSVRPGITSPASILYHDEERLLSNSNLMNDYFMNILPDKIRLDRLYIRYHSFFSDLDVIFWTLAILIPQIAKTRIPEGYIFAGPFTVLIRRYLSWFMIDLGTALFAVALASILSRISGPLNWGTSQLTMLGLLLAFLFSTVNSILGINNVIWSEAQSDDAIGLVFSCALATTLSVILDYLQLRFHLLPYPPLPPMMMLTIGLLAGAGFITVRYRMRLISKIATKWLSWRKSKVNVGERVIIVGMGEGTQIASWLIKRQMFRTAFSVIGIVDHVNPTAYGMKVNGLRMLGGINDLPTLIKIYDVGVILSAVPKKSIEIEYLLKLNNISSTRIIFLNDLLSIVDDQVTKPIRKFDYPLWFDERLEFMALHDNLTKLPNSTLFQSHLRHILANAKRNTTKHACMFVVLKRFPFAPDNLVRNSQIKEIANRLIHTKREVDILSRFNDDMFALLLENVPDETRLDLIIKRISDSLSKPFEINGQEIKIEANIFVSMCTNTCEAAENPNNLNIKQCYECARAKSISTKREVIQ